MNYRVNDNPTSGMDGWMAYVSSPENFLNSLKNKILLPGVSLGEGRGEGHRW